MVPPRHKVSNMDEFQVDLSLLLANRLFSGRA